MANNGKKAVAEEKKTGIRDKKILDIPYTEEEQISHWEDTFNEEVVASTTSKIDNVVGYIKEYVNLMIAKEHFNKPVTVLKIFKMVDRKHIMPYGDDGKQSQIVTGTDVRKAIARLMSNEVYKEELHAKGYRLITNIGTGEGATFKQVKPEAEKDENGNPIYIERTVDGKKQNVKKTNRTTTTITLIELN